MTTLLFKNASVVNEGHVVETDVLIENGRISQIARDISAPAAADCRVIDATGKHLLPGMIDDQVHFREPGFPKKGTIATESKAAVAGGITTYMEMPNTKPQATTQAELAKKYARAAEVSAVNYSFFMGATNNNLDEVLKTDPTKVCGIKVFMGSSTGNMLVDDEKTLSEIFRNAPTLVATHCEDEEIIRRNTEIYRQKYGEIVPISRHPKIRSAEACFKSSSKAVELARKYDTRLHVLHLSSAEEMQLFDAGPVKDKKVTAEVCVHHLWFEEKDYIAYGTRIKWNPAVKSANDRQALWEALLADKIDVIATDHAPHTLDEKSHAYFQAPSGGPLVQHSLTAMLEFVKQGKLSAEKVVEKMCHAPADLFRIDRRGYIREGYYADLVLVNPDKAWTVCPENIFYKCGWSPFEGTTFSHQVSKVFVNGELAYDRGEVKKHVRGKQLNFVV